MRSSRTGSLSSPRTRSTAGTPTALELLDERGAEGVSVRGVADRRGVRMNTVLRHTKSKARLLELMADAIVDEVPLRRPHANGRPPGPAGRSSTSSWGRPRRSRPPTGPRARPWPRPWRPAGNRP
ncbi:TetR/AcrR family transcriptional regulator [Streptomyces virginiae]|uniref:TetR/AcrR family transcriptional regulator n=1 Tax=Streptomyces virginiae TaxID=1961 RepID=UPI00381A0A28